MGRATRDETIALPGHSTDAIDTIPLLPALTDDEPRKSKLQGALQRARTIVLRKPASKTRVVAAKPVAVLAKRRPAQKSPSRPGEHWRTVVLAVTAVGLWAYVLQAIAGA